LRRIKDTRMTQTYIAETLLKFMERIKEIERAWESKKDGEPGLWYRGSRKSNWPLLPKLYRPHSTINELLSAEDEIREEFVRRAPGLTSYKPANAWEWYFLMQHYGAPTRLLDWTENPQIGLYFALKDSDGLHDAVVWVIDPWWLNGIVLGKGYSEVLPAGSPGLSEADARRYQPWLPDRFDAKAKLTTKLPVAIYPTQFDARIAAQRSCFTVHGRRRARLNELFPKPTDHLARIVIPSYATDDIRDELDDYGIDEAVIYPDLEGLGKGVTRHWLPDDDEKLPHTGILTRLKPSPIHGVGVFAIVPIKKDTRLFSQDSDEMRWIKPDQLPTNSLRNSMMISLS
jgi:FRG domain-containing protein